MSRKRSPSTDKASNGPKKTRLQQYEPVDAPLARAPSPESDWDDKEPAAVSARAEQTSGAVTLDLPCVVDNHGLVQFGDHLQLIKPGDTVELEYIDCASGGKATGRADVVRFSEDGSMVVNWQYSRQQALEEKLLTKEQADEKGLGRGDWAASDHDDQKTVADVVGIIRDEDKPVLFLSTQSPSPPRRLDSDDEAESKTLSVQKKKTRVYLVDEEKQFRAALCAAPKTLWRTDFGLNLRTYIEALMPNPARTHSLATQDLRRDILGAPGDHDLYKLTGAVYEFTAIEPVHARCGYCYKEKNCTISAKRVGFSASFRLGSSCARRLKQLVTVCLMFKTAYDWMQSLDHEEADEKAELRRHYLAVQKAMQYTDIGY